MSTFFKTHRLALGLAVPVLLLGSALVAVVGFHPTPPWASAQSSGCSFLSSPSSTPAFCDTFDAPAGIGNRSGDLNGTVWGVSRLTQDMNPWLGQYDEWATTTLNLCGTSVSAQPESDVRICNGHIAEAQNDMENAATLAMYPKQPFDIAGRTGTVEFDVSNDTQGPHAAWPEFWYTDQPVPSPFTAFPGNNSAPRNGVGLRFHNPCTTGSGVAGWAFGTIDVVSNYKSQDSFMGTSGANIASSGCVSQGSASAGTLNHVELHISTSRIDVYATDAFKPGSTMPALQHITTITNITLPLTRGLIWITDAHYSGNKFNSQGTHTFYWDNVAFDGPVLPQDRAFDVMDNKSTQSGGSVNLGWHIPASASQSLSVPNVTSSAISNATGAIVTFNYWAPYALNTFHVSVNGHSHDATNPTTSTFVTHSLAIPISVSDVVPGTNTVTFTTDSSSEVIVANVDIIMVGGGGSGGTSSTSGSTSSSTSTPTTAPAPTPVTINGVPCTVTINGQQQTGTCNGSFTPSK